MSNNPDSIMPTAKRLFLTILLILSAYTGVVMVQNWMFWGDAPDGKVGILFDDRMMKQAGISCPGPWLFAWTRLLPGTDALQPE